MPYRREIYASNRMLLSQPNLECSRRPSPGVLLLVASIALLFVSGALAQVANQTPGDQAPAKPASSSPAEKIPGASLYNLLQKKSVVFPDIAASDERLSSGAKFKLFVDNSGSVHTISWAVLGSAIAQADNSPTGYGQGWDAYAKRFGASMARQASSEFFGTFVIASALHLDPRFYPEVNPSLAHAAKYSVKTVFIMRNDEGREVIGWSRLVGPLMSESLANVYWPERNRTVGDTFFRYGLDLATRAGGNMLREYWPVVYRKMGHTTGPAAPHN